MYLSFFIIFGVLLGILALFAYSYVPLPTKRDRFHFAVGVIPIGLLLSGLNFFLADMFFTKAVDVAFRGAPAPTGFIWSFSRHPGPKSLYAMLSLLPLPTIGAVFYYRFLKNRSD